MGGLPILNVASAVYGFRSPPLTRQSHDASWWVGSEVGAPRRWFDDCAAAGLVCLHDAHFELQVLFVVVMEKKRVDRMRMVRSEKSAVRGLSE